MLTKNDLQEIRNIIREEVQTQTPEIVREVVKIELKPVKSDIAKMRKDVDVMLSMFDREYLDLRQRVERIEEHLELHEMQKN